MRGIRQRQIFTLVLFVLVLVGIFAGLISVSVFIAESLPAGSGFWVPYLGARGFLSQTDPYSGTIALQIQNEVLGRRSIAGEPFYAVDYPFYILMFYLPLGLVKDPIIARVIWMILLEFVTVLLILIGIRLVEWEVNWFWTILLSLVGLGWFYGAEAIVDGSPSLVLVLIYAGVFMALRSESDELAGILLALGSFKWEIVGFLAFMIFIWVYVQKRMRVFLGFGMAMIVLLAISFLVYPGWLLPFVRAVAANLRNDGGVTVGTILSGWTPVWGSRIAFGFSILLLIAMVFEWRVANTRAEFRQFFWAGCLTLAATPLMGFSTGLANFAPLLLPLLITLSMAWERWRRFGTWLTILLAALIFFVPWAIHYRGAFYFGDKTNSILLLIIPIFSVIGLYWSRWWFMRPPRTWLDQVEQMGHK